MKTTRAILATVSLATPIVLGATAPAFAAAPANDVFAGATPLGLGGSVSLDTTEATTDADDIEANQFCGAPTTDASVWYSFTPAADGVVIADVGSSSYSAGLIVSTGAPGSLGLVACGPGGVLFSTTAGTTYSILVIDDQYDGGGNGGSLTITLSALPDAPTVSVAVDPTGLVNARTGTATLSGTVTCTDANFVSANGQLTQPVGRFRITGFFQFSSGGQCDGTPHPWTAVVTGDGKFAGGKSAAVTFSFACGMFQCSSGFNEQTVQLKGSKK